MPIERSEEWHSALASLWGRQQKWSQQADTLKQAQVSWSGPLIWAAFLGTVLSTLSPYLIAQFWPHDTSGAPAMALTLAGPLIAALAAALVKEMLTPKARSTWVNARLLSEDLKGEGYLFAAGATPYADPATAPQLLDQKIEALENDAGDLGNAREPQPKEHKHPQEALERTDYLASRVDAQIKWHRDKATTYDDQLRKWKTIAIAIGLLSIAVGVVATAMHAPAFNAWVAVVSAALATVTTYVYASQFDLLANMYFNTADRLERLKRRWSVTPDKSDDAWQRFMLDCEAVIAAQNRTWSDKMRPAPPPQQP